MSLKLRTGSLASLLLVSVARAQTPAPVPTSTPIPRVISTPIPRVVSTPIPRVVKPTPKPTALPKKKLADQLGLKDSGPQTGAAPSEIKKPVELGADGEAEAEAQAKTVSAPVSAPTAAAATATSSAAVVSEAPPSATALPDPPTPVPVSTPIPRTTRRSRALNAGSASSAAASSAAASNGSASGSAAASSASSASYIHSSSVSTQTSTHGAESAGPIPPAATVRMHEIDDDDDDHGGGRRSTWNPRRPIFSVGLGYVHSRWHSIGAPLRNGSLSFDVQAARPFANGFEGVIGVNMLFINTNSAAENSNGAVALDLGGRWMPFRRMDLVRPYAGLALSLGSYRVWSVLFENGNFVTYQKHASGMLIGLVPALGLRVPLGERFAIDGELNYRAYFDNPANKVGGIGALLRLNFTR